MLLEALDRSLCINIRRKFKILREKYISKDVYAYVFSVVLVGRKESRYSMLGVENFTSLYFCH